MVSPRRIGSPDAKNREVLLDATEQLIIEEGYASVSSRRVADKAGLKPQLVHYYFRTMDDLFLALLQRNGEVGLAVQAAALASDRPLTALWEFNRVSASTGLAMELAAMANHRKTVRDEVARWAQRFRDAELAAMPDLLRRYHVDSDQWSPAAVVIAMASIPRVVALEQAMGMSGGHEETMAYVEALIRDLEERAAANGEA
jgi:AcrR family transcriptional regulator